MFKGLSCLASVLATMTLISPSRADPWDDAQVLYVQVAKAKEENNYLEVVSLYERIAALLAMDTELQDGYGMATRAELQRDLARAMAQAGTGQPCNALLQGQALLEQARHQLGPNRTATELDELKNSEELMAREQRLNRCAASEPRPDQAAPDGR